MRAGEPLVRLVHARHRAAPPLCSLPDGVGGAPAALEVGAEGELQLREQRRLVGRQHVAGGGAAQHLAQPRVARHRRGVAPRLLGQLLRILQESVASELASRMQAMQSATDNAKDLQGRLETEMNRARQAKITQELMEIIAGADATQ